MALGPARAVIHPQKGFVLITRFPSKSGAGAFCACGVFHDIGELSRIQDLFKSAGFPCSYVGNRLSDDRSCVESYGCACDKELAGQELAQAKAFANRQGLFVFDGMRHSIELCELARQSYAAIQEALQCKESIALALRCPEDPSSKNKKNLGL